MRCTWPFIDVRTLTLLAVLAFGCVLPRDCRAQFVGLGAAADYGVVDGGSTLSLNSVTGTTSVAATSGSTVTGSSGGGFTGTLYADNANTSSLNGFHFTGGVVTTRSLSQALSDAVTASSNASAQTPTQTVSGGSINNSITINATASQNVINLSNLNLNSGNTLTINGTASQTFIFNVTGSFNFNGAVALTGGMVASHVLFNITSGNSISLGGNPNGTILALNSQINVNNTNVTGALLSERGINFSTGTFNAAPFKAVPEPSSLLLGGLAAAIYGGIRYRRRRSAGEGAEGASAA